MAHKFLTDVDVKGSINVAGKVESAELDSTKLAINGVELQTPAGVAGPITVATSTQITEINETLETKQENLVVEAYSGIVLSADNKIAVDTSVIATAETVAAAQSAADAAQDAADENAEAIEAIKTTGVNSTVTLTDPEQADDVAAIVAHLTAAGKTSVKGDTAIVKRTISGTKVSHTAYVFDGANWAAMDGNYSAKNVYFDTNITATKNVGTISIPSSGSTDFAISGLNVHQAFQKLLAQEQYPAAPTSPSAVINITNGTRNYEVGASVTPSYSAYFTPGSYTYGPATGVTHTAATITDNFATNGTGSIATIAANTLSSSSSKPTTGTLPAITMEDGHVSAGYQITLNYGWTAGATPLTNLGNDATVDQEGATGTKVSAIAAASGKTASSSNKITAFRRAFYGAIDTQITDEAQLTSALIRGLSGKSSGGFAANSTGAATTTANKSQCVIFAYLGSLRDCTEIIHAGTKYDVKSSFSGPVTVSVADAGGQTTADDGSVTLSNPKDYKVYYMNFTPSDATDTYTLKV
jgi:hypothetical protein